MYEDNFAQSMEEYLTNSGQFDDEGNRLVLNTESNGRLHTDWLNMIYPRLRLSKDLLSEKGVIFIAIDHNEHANLKQLCDLIFGVQCYIAEIAWRSSDNSNNNALTFFGRLQYHFGICKRPDWKPNFLNDPSNESSF